MGNESVRRQIPDKLAENAVDQLGLEKSGGTDFSCRGLFHA